MQLRSDAIKRGLARAPHRSLLKADGLTDEELDRPLVAVVSAQNEVIPGHLHLQQIADAVKAGVRMAGGTPLQVNTIGVCDGIAMNHEGMKYSLTSREVIADSVECAIRGHQFDAMVLIPSCDKIVPGMLIAACRLNIPTVLVSGGPMLAGRGRHGEQTDLNSLFDAVGQVTAGTMTEEECHWLEGTACPTCGSCSGMFTANSMNSLTEAIGLSLPGNGTILASHVNRVELLKQAARQIVKNAFAYYEDGDESVLPRSIATREAFLNAMETREIKDKVFATFGSYTWAKGVNDNEFNKFAERLKLPIAATMNISRSLNEATKAQAQSLANQITPLLTL